MDSLLTFSDALVNWLAHGLVSFSGWEVVLITILMTHVTIAAVTMFLHRAQAPRAR